MKNAHFISEKDVQQIFEEAASFGKQRKERRPVFSKLLPEEFPEYGGFTHGIQLYGFDSELRTIHAQLCEEIRRIA